MVEKVIYHLGTTQGAEGVSEHAPYFITTLDQHLVNLILGWMDRFDSVLKGVNEVTIFGQYACQFVEARPFTRERLSSEDLEKGVFASYCDEEGRDEILVGQNNLHITADKATWRTGVAVSFGHPDVVLRARSLSITKADLLRLLPQLEK
jgi:hypothetical protein